MNVYVLRGRNHLFYYVRVIFFFGVEIRVFIITKRSFHGKERVFSIFIECASLLYMIRKMTYKDLRL